MPDDSHPAYISRHPFKVRSYEVGTDKKATLSSVCNYFQEAAGVHAQQLQFDISRLQKQNLTWVLYKMHVKIDRFPGRWDNIEVETWPSSGDELRAFRDYRLTNKKGETLGTAISQWMVLDMKSRRPVRMPEPVLQMGIPAGHHVIEIDKSPVEGVKNPDYKFLLRVGEFNLDMNNHVNNVSYIEWITGFRPEELAGKTCREINIQYIKEAVLDDEIHMAVQPLVEPGYYRHSLYKNQNPVVIANAITRWE